MRSVRQEVFKQNESIRSQRGRRGSVNIVFAFEIDRISDAAN